MKKRFFIILSIIVLMIITGRIFSETYFFKHLELLSYDFRSKFNTDYSFWNKDTNTADSNIVIVAIDNLSEKTLLKSSSKALGQQEWEHDVWKNVVNFIERGNPKMVMFDMVFEKPEDKPWYDASFAQTLKTYPNIILGTYLDDPIVKENNFTKSIELIKNDFTPTATPLDVTIDSKKLDDIITYTTNAPVNNIYTEHNTIGVINNVLDDDAIVRKNQPLFKLIKDEKTYYMPSLAFAGFLKYMGEGGKIEVKGGKIYYKGRIIPIDEEGIVNISWHKLGRSYIYIPISKILLNRGGEKDLKPEFFKDKIVIIGKTATGSKVDIDSIINKSFTGPEVNAVALDNFINDTNLDNKQSRKFVHEIPKPFEILMTVIACLFVALLGLLPQSAVIGFLNGFISIIFYLSFSFWMFVNPASRIWLPMVGPLYYLAMTAIAVFAFRLWGEMTRKTSMMNVFGKFVAPQILAKILKDPKKFILKNTKKRITILFCDVKDFSGLCEKYPPEQLVNNLNELFKEIVSIIFQNNGTVDKFIGDCIMAYWGDLTEAAEEEFLAVKTAIEIKKRINELKITNMQEGKIVFDVKIGINTGEAVLGLAGTDKIMNYTAMGDAVNTASRLETSCSAYKKDILISKSTYNAVKEKIIALEVGKISLKGKEEQIEVYEPIDFI